MAQGTIQKPEYKSTHNLLAYSEVKDNSDYNTGNLIPPKHRYDLRKETN